MNRNPLRFGQMLQLVLVLAVVANFVVAAFPTNLTALAAPEVNQTALNSASNLKSAPSAVAASSSCPSSSPLTTTLTYLGPITGTYSRTLSLAALLTDPNGQPVTSRNVTFTLGSQSATTQTDSNGVAKAPLVPGAAPGAVTATLAFGGDSTYSSSQVTQSITIGKLPTRVIYTGSVPGSSVPQQQYSATLVEADTSAPVAGANLSFSIGSAIVTGTTNAQGQVTVTLTIGADQAIGANPLLINYAGDSYHLSGQLSVPSSIYLDTAFGAVVVRHTPNFSSNALVQGTIRQLNPEYVTLNTGVVVNGDILVPGTPSIQINGTPTFGGVVTGTGSASPTNYAVTLNQGSQLGHVVIRTDPITLSNVPNPPASSGTRSVTINSPSDSIGDPTTLLNLSLNANVGGIAVPPGTYGQFTANDGSQFVLGVAGSISPTVYNLQNLNLNGTASLNVVGPVELNVQYGFSYNNLMGSSSHPLWLELNIASNGLTLNSGALFYGTLRAPSGYVTINGGSTLQGSLFADGLSFNAGATAKIQAITVTTGTAPALTASETGPAQVLPGQNFNFSLSVTNTTSVSATNVTAQQSFGGTTPVSHTTALGTLVGSSNVVTTLNQTVPAIASKGGSESDTAYQARLSSFDARPLTATGYLTYTDTAGQGYTPLYVSSTPTTSLGVPILSLGLAAPSCAGPGETQSYTVRVANLGSAVATTGTVTATFPDNSSGSLTFTSLTAGAVYSGTLTWTVPLTQSVGTTLTTTARVTWQDGQANAYGPVGASLITTVGTSSGGGGGNAASITAAAGTPQSVVVSHTLATQLQALVKDATNTPVSGAVVTFTAPSPPPNSSSSQGALPGGTFAGGVVTTTATTNASGLATAALFTSNIYASSYVVSATVAGVATPALFNLTNLDIPAPPNDLTATAGDAQVNLSWVAPVYTGSAVITGYNIYRLQNNNPVKLNATPQSATTYLDTGLTNNQEYFYLVTALNSVGESGLSFWARAIPRSTQPVQGAPALTSAIGRSGQVLLEWRANPITGHPDATNYKLYRQDSGQANPVNIATVSAAQTIYTDTNLTNGTVYTYTVTAINSAGESQPSNALAAAPHAQAVVPGAPTLLNATASSTAITLTWQAPSAPGGPSITGYNVYRLDANNVPVKLNNSPLLGSTFTYTDSGLTPGTTYQYLVTALSADGEGDFSNLLSATTLTSDYGSLPPPSDPLTPTSFYTFTSFIYTGASPVQTGVAAGTIDPSRVAILRGQVKKLDGSALTGVTITILGHPEYGSTQTQSDGWFSMAVNGGGLLVIDYKLANYIPSQRQVNPGWQSYTLAPAVTLIGYDSNVTSISLGSGASSMQVAQGSTVTDSDGSRRATLLFPAGITASLKLANGTTQALSSSMHVRATEYTVGPNGPSAMPADLPPTSGYTYAAEFSLDEALSAGASQISFNQPVINYNANFLNLPVGWKIPVGYYDRQVGQWIPSRDGLVVKILRIDQGQAVLDVDGSGNDASQSALDTLGITQAELTSLATLYSAGQSLWRVTIDHFTPFDCNFPLGRSGSIPQPPPSRGDCPTCEGLTPTSNIYNTYNNATHTAEDSFKILAASAAASTPQLASNSQPVSGTNFSLQFQNNWLPDVPSNNTLIIPLTVLPSGVTSLPSQIYGVRLTIEIAGRQTIQFFPTTPGQKYTFVWDGKDAFGRTVRTAQIAKINVAHIGTSDYELALALERSFGWPSGTASSYFSRQPNIYDQQWYVIMGSWDTRGLGLGGWTLDQLHFYDTLTRQLYQGDGTRRTPTVDSNGIKTIAGNGQTANSTGDGGPASQAQLAPGAMAAGPDGTLYIADAEHNVVRKISHNGTITTIAGGGTAGIGDRGPATQAELNQPGGLALSPDGNSLYIANTGTHTVRKVDLTSGIITTVAGKIVTNVDTYSGNVSYVGNFSGDGGPATEAQLNTPTGLAVGADGSFYIADNLNQRIRRVAPDGTINTYAGNGVVDESGDGGPATQAPLAHPTSVAVGPDGSIYIGDAARIRQVSSSGIITSLASPGLVTSLFVDKDGTVYFLDRSHYRLQRLDATNTITTIAGTGQQGFSGDGGQAIKAQIDTTYFAVGPNGNIYLSDVGRVRQINSPLPGFTNQEFSIASQDGSQTYVFDANGRHLRTLNAQTSAVIYKFEYDTSGQLTAIKDGNDASLLTVTRAGSGSPILLTSAAGIQTQLTLDGDGYAEDIITLSAGGSSGQSLAGAQGDKFLFPVKKSGAVRNTFADSSNLDVTATPFISPTVFGGCNGGGVRSVEFYDLGAVSEQLPCQRVNTSTRNYVASTADLSLASPAGAEGLGLSFGLNYNSQDPISGTLGLAAWRHSYQWELLEGQENLVITNTDGTHQEVTIPVATVTTPSGRRDFYETYITDTTQYKVPRLTDATLVKNADGSYTLTELDLTTYTFVGGKLDHIRDRNQNGVNLKYDNPGGVISKVSLCLGQGGNCSGAFQVLNIATNSDGFINSVTEPTSNFTVQYGYDNNLLTIITDTNGTITHLDYYTNTNPSRLKTVTAPNGAKIISLAYDGDGRVTAATDGLNQTVKFDTCCREIFNRDGTVDNTPKIRSTIVTDIRGNNVYYCWDQLFRTLRMTDQEGGTTNYFYDKADHLTKLQNPNGNWTIFTYDPTGLLLTTRQDVTVNGGVQTYVKTITYNPRNQNHTITETPRGAVTTYNFDNGQDNPSSVKDSQGNTITYQYDPAFAGRIQHTSTSNGLTTDYTYDAHGYPSLATETFSTLVGTSLQPTSVAYDTKYIYDNLGRLTFQSDRGNVNQGMSYVFDNLGHVLRVTNQLGLKTTNIYDPVGNLITTTNFLSQTIGYTYDANNQITSSTQEVRAGDIVNTYHYEGGNVFLQIDPNHVLTSFKYDRLNRLVSSNTPLKAGGNAVKTNEYDKLTNVVKSTRANNANGGDQVTCYKYDEVNRPVEITVACGSLNYKTTNVFDQGGNITETHRTIDSNRELVVKASYDNLNHPLTQQLNNYNPLTGVTTQLVTNYSYNYAANKTTITDPYGRLTTVQNDALGRTISSTLSAGGLAQTNINYYNPTGQIIRALDPASNVRTYNFDSLKRLTSKTEYSPEMGPSKALVTTYSYVDAVRPSIGVIGPDPFNTEQHVEIDEAGRTYQIRQQNDNGWLITQNEYDPQGNVIKTRDPNQQLVNYQYENTGWLLSTSQTVLVGSPVINSRVDTVNTTYSYDRVGNRTKITDPNGHATNFTYDVLNRLKTQADPLGHTYSFDYDGLARRKSQQDPKGQITNYTYDDASFLVKIADSANLLATSFTNNALGQPTRMDDVSNGNTSTTNYVYDPLGRMTSANNLQAGEVIYQYDNLNRQTLLSSNLTVGAGLGAAGSHYVTYTYDVWNRVTSMAENANSARAFIFTYKGERLDQIQYPGYGSTPDPNVRAVARLEYDQASRLTAITYKAPNDTTILAVGYSLDNLGNWLTTSEQTAGVGGVKPVNTYQWATYDALNRLLYAQEYVTKGAEYDGNVTGNAYDYDLSGNRTYSNVKDVKNNQLLNSSLYNYDGADRLITQTMRTEAFDNQPVMTTTISSGYDLNNSLITQHSANPVISRNEYVTYTYDIRNRMSKWEQSTITGTDPIINANILFSYDGAGRRTQVQQTDLFGTRTIGYLQDYANPLPVVLRETGNPGEKSYFYLPGSSAPLINLEGATSPVRSYNHLDGLGSLRVTTDGNDRPDAILDYFGFSDPFGTIDSNTSKGNEASPQNSSNRLAGEQLDQTGLYYNRARYYNPSTGRFNQQDTYSGNAYDATSLNRFAYARNNPTTYIDPSGHFPWLALAIVLAVSASYGSQVSNNLYVNHYSFLDAFTKNIDLVQLSTSAIVATTGYGLGALFIPTGAGVIGTLAGSIIAGRSTRIVGNLLTGQNIGKKLFDLDDIAFDFFSGGVAYGAGRIARLQARNSSSGASRDLFDGDLNFGPSASGFDIPPVHWNQLEGNEFDLRVQAHVAGLGETVFDTKIGQNGFDFGSYTGSGTNVQLYLNEVKNYSGSVGLREFTSLGFGRSGMATFQRNLNVTRTAIQQDASIPNATRQALLTQLNNRTAIIRLIGRAGATRFTNRTVQRITNGTGYPTQSGPFVQ